MDYFWGSVKLMLIVWGLAAFISFLVAWIIKLIFAVIRRKGSASHAAAGAAAAPPAAATDRPKRST